MSTGSPEYFQVPVEGEVVDRLAGIASDLNLPDVASIVNGILKEKIFQITGENLAKPVVQKPSVSLTQPQNPSVDVMNLADELIAASSNDGMLSNSLGPSLNSEATLNDLPSSLQKQAATYVAPAPTPNDNQVNTQDSEIKNMLMSLSNEIRTIGSRVESIEGAQKPVPFVQAGKKSSRPEDSPHWRADGVPPGLYPRCAETFVMDPTVKPATSDRCTPYTQVNNAEGRSIHRFLGWRSPPKKTQGRQAAPVVNHKLPPSIREAPVAWHHSSMFPDHKSTQVEYPTDDKKGKRRIFISPG